jgi:hypothetical protein
MTKGILRIRHTDSITSSRNRQRGWLWPRALKPSHSGGQQFLLGYPREAENRRLKLLQVSWRTTTTLDELFIGYFCVGGCVGLCSNEDAIKAHLTPAPSRPRIHYCCVWPANPQRGTSSEGGNTSHQRPGPAPGHPDSGLADTYVQKRPGSRLLPEAPIEEQYSGQYDNKSIKSSGYPSRSIACLKASASFDLVRVKQSQTKTTSVVRNKLHVSRWLGCPSNTDTAQKLLRSRKPFLRCLYPLPPEVCSEHEGDYDLVHHV